MGHPVLRQKARPIENKELKAVPLQKFIDDMIETMHEYTGVGLAAPQVHESLRVFVAHLDPEGRGEGDPVAIINPEIEVVGDDVIEGWEGCLSIPDIRGRVPRALQISRDRARSPRQAHRDRRQGFSRARHPARNRSPRRRAVLRSHAIVRVADVHGGVLALPLAARRRRRRVSVQFNARRASLPEAAAASVARLPWRLPNPTVT